MVISNAGAFVLTSVLVLVPWLYFTIRGQRFTGGRRLDAQSKDRRDQQPNPTVASTTATASSTLGTRRTLLTALVVLHSIFIIYNICLRRPPNIFKELGVPLTTPVDALRAQILAHAQTAIFPVELELLLARLSKYDTRVAFLRYVCFSIC